MTQRLTSEELGRHGENLFPPLCPGLAVNKAHQDLTGWDYRVELTNKYLDTSTYADKRPPLPAFNFQIKSMWAPAKKFSAPLVSMERLAKATDPSFVFVMRFNPDLSIRDTFVVHLAGAPLDHVLKRLTKEGSSGRPVTNKQTITFTKNADWQSVPYEPNTDKLLQCIQRMCREYAVSHDYYETKRLQRETSGYDGRRISLKISIQAKTEEEMVEGFLGLRPLRVTKFASFEKRFGIERPHHFQFSGIGEMSIMPTGKPDCKIIFRRGRNGFPVVRFGTAVAPPFLPSAPQKMRFVISSPPVSLDVNFAGTFTLTVADLQAEKRPVGWWIEVYQILNMMASEEFFLELYSPDGKKVFNSNLGTGAQIDRDDAKHFAAVLRALEGIERITERIGVTNSQLSLGDIEAADIGVQAVLSLVDEIGKPFHARLDAKKASVEELIGVPQPGIMVQAIQVGDTSIMYCAVAEMTLTHEEPDETVLRAVTTQNGYLEAGNSMTLSEFAQQCSKEVTPVYRIIGGDQATQGPVAEPSTLSARQAS
ncbi:hypothetical protein ACVILI_005986 [Mesorhizobium sp. USDA 4775]